MVHDNPGNSPELVAAGRRPSVAAQDLREALAQILALAEHAQGISPPVTTIGHRDPWADVGKRAVKIARDVLEDDES